VYSTNKVIHLCTSTYYRSYKIIKALFKLHRQRRVGLNHFPGYNSRIEECLLCDMRKVGEREVGRRGRGRWGRGRGEREGVLQGDLVGN
jgi:hypothetical protein